MSDTTTDPKKRGPDPSAPPPMHDPTSAQRWDADVALPNPRSNRPVTIGHHIEAFFAKAFFGLFWLIGLDASSAFMGKTLRLIGPLLIPIHRRGMDNLDLVYPTMPREQKRAILKNTWENLGRLFAEFAHLKKLTALSDKPRVEIDGLDKLQRLSAGAQPIIFVGSHHANWEVMCPALFRAGVKYAFIYRPLNNPILDDTMINYRAQVMSRHQIPKGKRGGRELIATLKRGLSFATMVDQKLNTGIPSPFLGHEAMTAPATARLALKYNALIVPLSLRRKSGAYFSMEVHDPIALTPSENVSADVQRLTDLINVEIGNMVLENPGQWLWFHRRWPKQAYQLLNPTKGST
ncbi:MAG: lysophospholipid acyltransferase family protein [Parvularculaceae bacterium]